MNGVGQSSQGGPQKSVYWLAGIGLLLLIGVATKLVLYVTKTIPTDECWIGIGVICAFGIFLGALLWWSRRTAGGKKLFEVLTDVWIAGLVAVFFALVVFYVSYSLGGHGEAGGHVPEEGVKEVFFAALVGIVSFTLATVARVLYAFNSANRLEELADKHEHIVMRADRLAANATAGAAMAHLLNAADIWPHRERQKSADDELLGLREIALTDMLSALGRNGMNWAKYAGGIPTRGGPAVAFPSRAEVERASVRLRLGEAFAAEMASDIVRRDRLVVANIRYVTRLILTSLFGLRDLGALRNKAGQNWKPVWLAMTSFSPKLWFGPHDFSKRVLEEKLLHVQYWGRYLRLAGVAAKDCVHLRLFCSGEGATVLEHHPCSTALMWDGAKFSYEGGACAAADVAREFVRAAKARIADPEARTPDLLPT